MHGFSVRTLLFSAAAFAVCALSAFPIAPAASQSEPPSATTSADKLDFSEKQVAGGPDDFMIVRHVRMCGTNRAIGRKLAEIARSRHGFELSGEISDATKSRWDYCRKHYPTQYQRAVGVAELLGVSVDGPVDCMSLPYNLDVAPGCSVVYYPPKFTASAHPILSRNYDFSTATWAESSGRKPPPGVRPSTGDPYIIEVYPDEGHASLYLCAYDLLGGCLDGINVRGLTVALLANYEQGGSARPHPAGEARPGLNEIEIARYLLDRCATEDETRKALEAVDYYYSWIPCHYIIGDASGRSFIWEYSIEDGSRHVTDGDNKPQIITNHPVYQFRSLDSVPDGTSPLHTFSRFRRLAEQIAAAPQARSTDDIKQANQCVAACAPPSGRKPNRTLWHALYDCKDLTLDVDFYLGESAQSPEKPKRSGYQRFRLDAGQESRR